MKKFYYALIALLQGGMILSSIINILYCLITSDQKLFNTTIFLVFIPFIRFAKSNNILELLILIVFILISIVLFIKSIKELFDEKNKKAPFLALNGLWFIGSTGGAMFLCLNSDFSIFLDEEHIPLLVIYGIMYLMLLIELMIKWNKQNNNITAQRTLHRDKYLLENFQLRPTGYAQIKRTAKGSPIVAVICFFLCLLICYLNFELFKYCYLLYAISAVIMVMIFVSTLFDFRKYKSVSKDQPPTENYLKKLCKMQIISFLLFSLSFLLILFIKLFFGQRL